MSPNMIPTPQGMMINIAGLKSEQESLTKRHYAMDRLRRSLFECMDIGEKLPEPIGPEPAEADFLRAWIDLLDIDLAAMDARLGFLKSMLAATESRIVMPNSPVTS